MLSDAGADVTEFPGFEVSAPASRKALAQAVRALGRFDGVVFTSVAGVKGFLAGIEQAGLDSRALSGQILFAFGRSTIDSLARQGLRADVSLSSYDTTRAVTACGGPGRLRGKRLLFVTRDGVRSPLREALEGAGAVVEQVGAYGQVLRSEGAEALRHALDEGLVDVVVFPSSSSVDGWVKALGDAHHGRAVLAAIGPATAEALARHGERAAVVPSDPSVEALVGELVERFGHEAHANPLRDHGRHSGAAARRARLSAQP
jgi:uroporphyrinogen III methyltransferase/synthase